MTLHDIEIDQMIEKMKAERAMNNVDFCDWFAESLKCPRCRAFAKRMIARIAKRDEKITEIDRVLCA